MPVPKPKKKIPSRKNNENKDALRQEATNGIKTLRYLDRALRNFHAQHRRSYKDADNRRHVKDVLRVLFRSMKLNKTKTRQDLRDNVAKSAMFLLYKHLFDALE